MTSYLLRRLVGFVAVMVGISIITFGISHLVPADPAIVALGDHATDAQIEAFREKYGLNKPVPEQYWIYVTNLLRGDLRISLRTRRPVAADLRDFFPATFELSLTALFLSILIGVPAGVVSAQARNRLPDHIVRILTLIGGSVPIFWLGLILIGFFYGRLGWLPGGARIDKFIPPPPFVTGLFTVDSLLAGDAKAFWSSLHHLLLPALALGYFSTAIIARMMRSSMLEVLPREYVLAAHARGLRQRRVVWRHAASNALIPTVTTIGVTFGSLLSGAVLTETIFSWPGLGRYATNSALNLDFPAVMGVTLLAALIYTVTNLIVDVGYHWLDPRIRHG
ncbi:MAG: ABC transporter permease [Chloroflexi bacterium]|nr:MAG: ABC transporter permease [Chloroflexota bacterium]